MKFEYQQVDTRSEEGLKRAEKLKANGWRIISVGFCTLLFERLL